MLSLLALASIGHATEVGTVKKAGIGLSTGSHYGAITGKYYLSDSAGISAYAGNSWWYSGLRVNYEQYFYPVQNFGYAQVDLYWLAGLDAGIWNYYGYLPAVVGFGGGVGGDLRFEDYPLSVALDLGLGVFPVNARDELKDDVRFGLVAPRTSLSVRWYF